MATPRQPRKVPGRNGGTLTPFPKGTTGNANGRPHTARYMTEAIKEALETEAEIVIEGIAEADVRKGEKVKVKIKAPTRQVIIQALLRKAAKGDNKAIEMVLDRTEGRVPLPLGNDPENPLMPTSELPKLTPELIQKVADSL